VKGRRHETDGGGAGNEMVKPTDRGGSGSVVFLFRLAFQFTIMNKECLQENESIVLTSRISL